MTIYYIMKKILFLLNSLSDRMLEKPKKRKINKSRKKYVKYNFLNFKQFLSNYFCILLIMLFLMVLLITKSLEKEINIRTLYSINIINLTIKGIGDQKILSDYPFTKDDGTNETFI